MNVFPRFGRTVRSGLCNLARRKYSTPSATTSPPAPASPPNPPSPSSGKPASFESNAKYSLTKTKKMMCVWAKRYPSLSEVPDQVSPEVWSKVRSVVRIKVANYTMLLIVLGCIAMIITGKRARDRGESIEQRNLDWHKKYAEGKEDEVKNLNIFGK